jgi:shikimate dehydrogenase
MLKLALLGKDIQHSRSKEMYEKISKQKVDYTLFDYPDQDSIPNLEVLFESISGLSITSPYKKVFFENVDMNDSIKELGAINCIKKSGTNYYATNTDYLALIELFPQVLSDKFVNIYILGDGVMSKIITKVLDEQQEQYEIRSRRLNNLNNLAEETMRNNRPVLLINCCSREYIFKGDLPKNSVFWDLNYNMPDHLDYFSTKLIKYIDGLSLLEGQAKHALRFWNLDFS